MVSEAARQRVALLAMIADSAHFTRRSCLRRHGQTGAAEGGAHERWRRSSAGPLQRGRRPGLPLKAGAVVAVVAVVASVCHPDRWREGEAAAVLASLEQAEAAVVCLQRSGHPDWQ